VELTTMAEHYGEARAQGLADVEWIAETSRLGWIAFHEDPSIRRNTAERQAVIAHRARCLCIPRGDITAAQAAQRYLHNLVAIAEAAGEPGPFIYGVYPDRIKRLAID
jgi:PIN like domain